MSFVCLKKALYQRFSIFILFLLNNVRDPPKHGYTFSAVLAVNSKQWMNEQLLTEDNY